MKRANVTTGKEGGLIVIVEDPDAKIAVAGSGKDLSDAAGWALYHMQRHVDEARELFEKMGIKPTPLARLRPIPDFPPREKP